MKVTVDLSMYPLHANYKPLIIEFIECLRKQPQIRIETNGVSSQIYGEYDEVMMVIQKEVRKVFEGENKVSMVMKMVNDDLSGPITF